MPVSRNSFHADDRVRGAAWFDEIAGVVGTVVQAVEVRGDDWAAQDLLVRFDRPVVIFDEPQWTFCHSAHNFEHIENAHATPGEQEDPAAALRQELAALRQELADKSAFVQAASCVLQYNKMAADLEHARLMLEDVRSQQLR